MANIFGMNVPDAAAGANPNPTGSASYYNADPTDYNALLASNSTAAPIAGAPPPPFVPPPAITTPAQNAASFTPPPNPSPTAMQPVKGPSNIASPANSALPLSPIGQLPGPTPTAKDPTAFINSLNSAMAGKGSAKGPSGMQNTGMPVQNTFAAPTAPNMDFHTQLQNFINSGLLGGSQRLQG